MIEHAFEIRLAIPDNEAYTALATLQRLGVECAGIARTDIHVFGFDDDTDAGDLEAQLKTIATIFNPNKHRFGHEKSRGRAKVRCGYLRRRSRRCTSALRSAASSCGASARLGEPRLGGCWIAPGRTFQNRSWTKQLKRFSAILRSNEQ